MLLEGTRPGPGRRREPLTLAPLDALLVEPSSAAPALQRHRRRPALARRRRAAGAVEHAGDERGAAARDSTRTGRKRCRPSSAAEAARPPLARLSAGSAIVGGADQRRRLRARPGAGAGGAARGRAARGAAAAGLEVEDHGDREAWRWRPDRAEPRAQNLGTVVEIVARDRGRGSARRRSGEPSPSCSAATARSGSAPSPATSARGERVGLLYFDTHADLNVPDSVREGALDWMGMAHMLGEPGARPELVEVGGRGAAARAPSRCSCSAGGRSRRPSSSARRSSRRGIARDPRRRGRRRPEAAAARRAGPLEAALRSPARPLRRRRRRLHRHPALGELRAQRGPPLRDRAARSGAAARLPEARRR